MATVEIALPHHRYEILIEPGALGRLGALVRARAPHDRCALIVDENVEKVHGESALAALREAGYRPVIGRVQPGEKSKTLATVESLYGVLLEERLERRSPVIALGGGVVGDMAGFVAATYLRGVPFVQCPTSLLAMVDSSVGGKTGVNVPQGKNLVGAFHQPELVVIDPLVLRTLPHRELLCGLAECIKHGMIRDASLFEFVADNLSAILAIEPDVMVELVRRNVEIKAAVVVEDEREKGVRAHLNFGHTFAHAIEATSGYGEILHGEAVSLGMVAATRAAAAHGLCEAALADRLVALLEAAGMPTRAPLASDAELDAAMRLDKKVAEGRIRFILPSALGRVHIHDDLPEGCVREGWAAIRA